MLVLHEARMCQTRNTKVTPAFLEITLLLLAVYL